MAIIVGVFLKLPILNIFGAKGEIMPLADSYFTIVLYGIPFLAVSMMANNNLRAEGKAKIAMVALLIPSVLNVFLDYIFIDTYFIGEWKELGGPLTISYIGCAIYIIYFLFIWKWGVKSKTTTF